MWIPIISLAIRGSRSNMSSGHMLHGKNKAKQKGITTQFRAKHFHLGTTGQFKENRRKRLLGTRNNKGINVANDTMKLHEMPSAKLLISLKSLDQVGCFNKFHFFIRRARGSAARILETTFS